MQAEPDSMLGREAELARLRSGLPELGLAWVVGPAGAGKTSLAVALAETHDANVTWLRPGAAGLGLLIEAACAPVASPRELIIVDDLHLLGEPERDRLAYALDHAPRDG